jgi:hypothetical protein
MIPFQSIQRFFRRPNQTAPATNRMRSPILPHLEALEGRITPVNWSSITNSLTGANTVGLGGTNGKPFITISGTDLPTDISRVEFWQGGSAVGAFQVAPTFSTQGHVKLPFNPSSSTSQAGIYDVHVYTTTDTDIDTGLQLRICLPEATVSPSSGSINGGTTATISGKYLYNASSVVFGSNTATNFDQAANTDNQIIVQAPKSTLPAPGTGAVDVKLNFPRLSSPEKIGTYQYVVPTVPTWNFNIPPDVAKLGFQIAIFGQKTSDGTDVNGEFVYWNGSAWVQYSGLSTPYSTAPLITLTPINSQVSLPAWDPSDTADPYNNYLISGTVVMFIGSNQGVPVSGGLLSVPTVSTNAADTFSLFELTYASNAYDVDISNVDQVGFTYVVTSSSVNGEPVDSSNPSAAPIPLAQVGSPLDRARLFNRFQSQFPNNSPFNPCYTAGTVNGNQNRLVAPQDVLGNIKPPAALKQAGPANTSGATLSTDNTYWYVVTETNQFGETLGSPAVFGGYLLDKDGNNPAGNNSITIGWYGNYVPSNPSATGINFYRALAPKADAPTGTELPPNPTTPYHFLQSMSITDFNNLPGQVFIDNGSYSTTAMTPPASSYTFSPLSSWFNDPLWDFSNRYSSSGDNQTFSLYQANQAGGPNGTLWTGKVVDVTPNSHDPITALQYVSQKTGQLTSINTKWQDWNDSAQQTYRVLQLVGNAYDGNNLANPNPSSNLQAGEYEGAVVNIYFPFFQENSSPTVQFDNGAFTYTTPEAPAWLANNSFTPGQMVFACAGVFASDPGDPEAQAQQASFADLSSKAMTNLENVVVSALNRGIATGYTLKLAPQQWVSPIAFSQYPVVTGTSSGQSSNYTYHLSANLPGTEKMETVLSWPLSAQSGPGQSIELKWLPLPANHYQSANIYRLDSLGAMTLVGIVDNSTGLAQSFTDSFDPSTYPPAPVNGAPFNFYPGWKDPSAPGFVNSNLFSAFLHQNYSADPNHGVSINGLCYGYPFDDQGGFSTNINFGTAPTPKTITFAISPLNGGSLVSTTTSLASNNNPSHLNDPVTFTATVSPASGSVAPTGTFSFYDGATLLGTGNLTPSGLKAVATFTTTTLAVGAHSITAAYGGSNAFDGSTSSVLTQSVLVTPPAPVGTSVSLASNINPSNLNQAVTFTATVTAQKGIPSGTVNFLDGTQVIGSGILNGNGVATFQTSSLSLGSHPITAAFVASTTYAGSTSPVLTQVVATDGPAATATTLVPNPNPTYAGHTVTLTAVVAALRGTQVPTGTVIFLVDGTEVGSAQLSNGSATLQHAFATAGTYSLTAKYQGDASFTESQSSPTSEVVNQPSGSTVTVTLSSSVNPSTQGQLVLFTANLQPVAGSGSPTGIVDFYVNNVWQNSTTVFTDGSYGPVATWLTNSLPLGDNPVTASYRGDSSFDPAISKPWSQLVTANPNQIMQPADLGAGSYVAGVGSFLAVKPSHGAMQFFQPFPNYNGQITVNTMDRNGDGKADTILAAVAGGAAPHVLVIDANTGYLLSSFYAFAQGFLGGVTIAGGPVHLMASGQATPTIVCGARAGAQPAIAIFDAVGNSYGAFFAFDQNYKGGVNVAMSEADAQGNALVVVSSTINTHVKVFDIAGFKPAEIASYYTFGSASYSPGVWATAGDIDGDGAQELLVGTAGGTTAARMQVYSLLSGNAIPGKVVKPFGDSYLGSIRVGLSDYNRDGVLDLLAASGPGAMDTVRAFDFDTLAELESLFVSNVTDGVFIATNFSLAEGPLPS